MALHFPLHGLPLPLLLKVMQKMTPISFVRLRRSCKAMDTFAERYRNHIGILLFSITLTPLELSVDNNEEQLECILKELRYTANNIILLKINRTDDPELIFTDPSVAYKRLSGFIFDRVWINQPFKDRSNASFMEPEVFAEYMDFIRKQRWRTRAVHSDNAPMDIMNIIKPKTLRIMDGNMANIPKSVKTLEIVCLDNDILPNLRDIPRHIENFLVNLAIIVEDEYCLPLFICEPVTAFYDDQLSLSALELRSLTFSSISFLNLEKPDDKKAAQTILLHYLNDSPYRENGADSNCKSFSSKRKQKRDCEEFNKMIVTTSNSILSSRNGERALFSIRTESLFMDQRFVWLEVTVILRKNCLDYLLPTFQAQELIEGVGMFQD